MTQMVNYHISAASYQVTWSLKLEFSELIVRAEMQVDQDSLRRKNEELTQVLREKNRKLLQTQELYDKLKRRAMLGQVQDAASIAVEDTIHASTTANRFVDRVGVQIQRPTSHPIYQNAPNSGMQDSGRGANTGMEMGPPPINRAGDGVWSGFSSQASQGHVPRMYDESYTILT